MTDEDSETPYNRLHNVVSSPTSPVNWSDVEKATTSPAPGPRMHRVASDASFTSAIHAPADEEGASVRDVTLNLIGGGLGTGILSMPWGMAGGSIFISLVVMAVVLMINAFTIMILIYAGDKYEQFELGCLLSMLPGKFGQWSQFISNFLVWATLWGVLVGYCIVIQQQIVPFTPADASSELHWLHDKRIWTAVGTAIAIPLCFLNTKYLSFTSGLSVLVNVYLFGVLIAIFVDHTTNSEPLDFCYVGFGPGAVTFSSLMQYGVIIQFCVLPMYKEMQDRRPVAFGKALGMSFSFLFFLFSAFAVIGYMTFGPSVDSDILTNYPGTKHRSVGGLDTSSTLGIPANIAKLGMVMVVLGVYPLMMMPMISPVREYEKRARKDAERMPGFQPRSAWQRAVATPGLLSTIATFFIALTAMATSFFVDALGKLNAASGAAQASFFVGVFPTLIAYFLLEKQSPMWMAGLVVLTIGCCGVSMLGFVFIDNHWQNLEPGEGSACVWRAGSAANPHNNGSHNLTFVHWQ